MPIPRILKRKSTYVILALIAGSVFWYQYNRSKSAQPEYETAAVERRDLIQSVEVTGEIKPAERIELAFDRNGTVAKISVKVGKEVKEGHILAQLKNDDVVFAVKNASAALAKARAALNQKAAGYAKQDIRIGETNVDKAKAAYDKAVTDLEATRQTVQDDLKSAQLAVDTAKNKRDNQTATVNQSLNNAIDSERIALLTALGPLHTGLADGDQIVGVDDTATNSMYKNLLGIYDGTAMPTARQSYLAAKPVKLDAEIAVRALSASSAMAEVKAASDKLLKANLLVQTFLGDVQKVLATSIAGPNLTAAELAAKKTAIDADRVNISAQNTAVTNAVQAVKNVELTNQDTKQQLEDAYQSALVDLSIAQTKVTTDVKAAEADVAIQLAALESAQADLDLRKAAVREVELAPLRAAVLEADVALEKANNDLKRIQIVAPVDGTISEVLPSVGEQVALNAVAVKMVGTLEYDIEALIPEADIAKVKTSQTAKITLDAYGDDVMFDGKVAAIDPDQTKVQEAVYYKTRIQVEPAGRDVKPGMTANVTIITDERKNALVIPLRAVRTKEGTDEKIVRLLEAGSPNETTVELGLRGDEGRVEVVKGLNEGQTVVLSEKTR